ncbi:MAG: hypothetical protein JHD16_07335 [Solirubrobacteraceae bacterium]|nr:hypothetical protein [Solirubrobacteraceae bacterium]
MPAPSPLSVRVRVRAVALAVVLLSLLGLGTVSPASAAPSPVTKADLCAAWNAAGTANPEVQLSSGLTINAAKATRIGKNCTASGAGVALSGATVTKESSPSSGGNAAAQLLAAVTHAAGTDPDLKEGDEVFKGATIKNLNAVLKLGYFEISGSLEVKFSSTLTKLQFKGKLYGIDRYTLQLSSPVGGTLLPNVEGAGIDFTGVLVVQGDFINLDVNGEAPSLIFGQGDERVSVSDGRLKLSLNTNQTLHLAVAGTVGIGSRVSAEGNLDADFDEAGLKSLTGSGALTATIPARSSSPAGSITGDAAFSYTREPLVRSVTFTGDVRVGDALVAGGTGTLDDQSASFTGKVEYDGDKLSARAQVDGVVFYGDDLTGRTIENRAGAQVPATKGDYLIKSASGSVATQGLLLSGSLQIGDVAGEQWGVAGGSVDLTYAKPNQPDTKIKGSADIAWTGKTVTSVAFAGSITSGTTEVASAAGTIDGKKISFTGQVTSPTISGKASGVVYYGSDLAGETVTNRAGTDVAATRGDLILTVADGRVQVGSVLATANLQLRKVGSEIWVKTDAQLKVAQTWLSFSGEIDNAGNANLKGSGRVNFDGYVIDFQGTAVAKNGVLKLTGGGSFTTGLFTVQLSGTIEKPDAASSVYVLTGTANFKFGKYSVAGGTVRLTIGEGMTTTFSLKACVLFLCQNGTYKLYFNGNGTVNRAELNAPLTSVPLFLGIGSVALGSKVKISTKITGIL